MERKLFVVADKRGKLNKLPGAKTLLSKPGLELDVLNAMANVLLDEGLAQTDGVEGLEELKTALADFTPKRLPTHGGFCRIAAEQPRGNWPVPRTALF